MATKKNSKARTQTSKKRVAKKATAKPGAKRPVKKPAKRPVKKVASRKPSTKKAPVRKKAVPRKRPVKKAAQKRSSAKKAVAKPLAPRPSTSTLLIRDAIPTSVQEFKLQTPAPSATSAPQAAEAERKKLPIFLFAAVIGIVAPVAVSLSGGDEGIETDAKPIASQSPSASPSESASVSESATPTSSAAPEVIRLFPPREVFADYTAIGGVVTWEAPQGDLLPTQYLVQASYKGQEYKTIATLGPNARKLELIKIDTPSETVFRVVAVYSAGEVRSDISSIKGQYEVSG